MCQALLLNINVSTVKRTLTAERSLRSLDRNVWSQAFMAASREAPLRLFNGKHL